MRPVLVLIFHAEAPPEAPPLTRLLASARLALAERRREGFLAAGADEVRVVAGPPDGLPFGERLTAAIRGLGGGLVVLGSGSIPLARKSDLGAFVEAAAQSGQARSATGRTAGRVLTNNRYSADVVAIPRLADLDGLPPLPTDNALPRWLEEHAGAMVTELRGRWRLGVDVDTPLDLLVLERTGAVPPTGPAAELRARASLVGERLGALGEVLRDRRAELLVAGRVSASTLQWLESGVACRVRALVEERGLRAASRLAQAEGPVTQRPPRSVLGELLDRDGPESLARHVADLADAAVIDTRVLLAHRSGADEGALPTAEDRFASDLLRPGEIADPWLRGLTAAAATAPAGRPIVLGGHTMVNGGLRLLAAGERRPGAR